ncbi:MAG TPA: methyl-accepting chemotaxis protein, partial [Capillimicrobium sp.]
ADNLVVSSFLHRLPLAAKLAACFAVLIAIVAASTLFVQSGLSSLSADVRDRNVPFDHALSAFAVEAKAVANDERGFLLAGDTEFLDSIEERQAVVDEQLAAAARVAPTAALRADVAAIREGYDRWSQALEAEFRQFRTDPEAATAAALGPNRDLRKAYEERVDAAVERSVAAITGAFDAVDRQTSRTRTVLWAVLALLAAACALIGFAVVRMVRSAVGPVLERLGQVRDGEIASLRQGLGAMAEGDLTQELQATTPPLTAATSDQLGSVAGAVDAIRADAAASVDAYNETRAGLADLIGRVTASAGGVAGASQEMASTSEEAGRAVGEIAGAVTEVAQGAERQVRMVETARATAEQTRAAAAQARELAEQGAAASAEAATAMGAVREASGEVSDAIQSLAGKSSEISGIVQTITGIAEQTNLLALNAAIEAARAGDQGRGFAVVADEVRKLAEESQTAAGSIAGLISEIQTETDGAVAAVQLGAERSEHGSEVVEATRASFTEIAASVTDVAARIDEIAKATEEVAAVAEQSSASSEQVSASTEQTSASTQQIAASAQQLAGTARDLEALVGRFRLTASA